jgi:hypothetical protein
LSLIAERGSGQHALGAGFPIFDHCADLRGHCHESFSLALIGTRFAGKLRFKAACQICPSHQAEGAESSGKFMRSGMRILALLRGEAVRRCGCSRGFEDGDAIAHVGKKASPHLIQNLRKIRISAWLIRGIHGEATLIPAESVGNLVGKRERVERLEKDCLDAEIGEAPLVGPLHLGSQQQNGDARRCRILA